MKKSRLKDLNKLLSEWLRKNGFKRNKEGQAIGTLSPDIERTFAMGFLDVVDSYGYLVVWDGEEESRLIYDYDDEHFLTILWYDHLGDFFPKVVRANEILEKAVFYCFNCAEELDLREENDFSTICNECGWWFGLTDPIFKYGTPLTMISDRYGYCCPSVFENDINHLPEKLRSAVRDYFSKPNISRSQYQLMYHSLFKQDEKRLEDMAKKYAQRLKLTRFFQNFNQLYSKWRKMS